MVRTPRFVLVALALTAAVRFAAAGQVQHATSILAVPIGGTGSATLPQFDSSLGVLRTARVSIFCEVSGSVGFENPTGGPVGVGGYASGHFAGALVFWSGAGANGLPPTPAYIPPSVLLPAYDGVTDYSGTSGITHTFAGQSGDGSPGMAIDFFQEWDLPTFVGAGTISVRVLGVQLQASAPFNITSSVSLTADAYFSVRYEYDAFPARICGTYTYSGCPCANASPLASGCGNSLNANGGVLTSSGTASIANDTLTLNGAGMTNSNALYFQGSNFTHVQSVYGDGLRCVTGSVVRLGTRTNASGASQVPSVGGTPLSTVGGVATPGTRYYQVIYRDNGSFCTPSNFNATSGLAVAWTL